MFIIEKMHNKKLNFKLIKVVEKTKIINIYIRTIFNSKKYMNELLSICAKEIFCLTEIYIFKKPYIKLCNSFKTAQNEYL